MKGRWLPMATLVLAMQVPIVQASASLRSEIGSVSAMFIHNDSRNDASLEALASTLQTHYGLTADRLKRVKQQEAKGDRIGAALFESIRAMGPFDTLVVVVSLELHEDGRVLKTVDFDTAQPWTGLPAETLRKLAAVTRKGTLVLVMPDCPRGSAETAAQSSNPMAAGTDSESARATISFCASGHGRNDFVPDPPARDAGDDGASADNARAVAGVFRTRIGQRSRRRRTSDEGIRERTGVRGIRQQRRRLVAGLRRERAGAAVS